jgi:hypothetical protein
MNERIAITPIDWIDDLTQALRGGPASTIPAPARVLGIWNVIHGSRREFARIDLLAEPAAAWSAEDRVPEGSLGESEPHRAVLLRSAMLGMLDVLATSARPPPLNVRIVVEGARAHPTDSSEETFRKAEAWVDRSARAVWKIWAENQGLR